MPNAFVFPGGVLSASDSSSSWERVFRKCGFTQEDLDSVVLSNVDRPLLMKSEANEAVSRDIALRYNY